MPAATQEAAALFRAQIAEVKRQYEAGLWKVGIAATFSVDAFMGRASLTAEQKQMKLAREDLQLIETRYLPWALAGKRDNGTSYDSALFSLAVRDVALRIKDATNEAWNESVFTAIANVPHDTVVTVKQAAA
jgi:hypothetical protein